MAKKGQGDNIFGLHLGRIFKRNNLVYMIDEDQNTYPIEELCFLNKYFNSQEGEVEYPRVWEDTTEQIKETTGKTEPKKGDIVLFTFIKGMSKYPVILGSISQLNLFGDKYRVEFEKFLDMQEKRILIKENIKRKIVEKEDGFGNIEKTVTTYEDKENWADENVQEERGTIDFKVGKDGEIVLDITELAEKTGTGNITLNLKGNDGQVNGNINLNFNGKLNLINTDNEGIANGNKIEIDNTDGEEKINIEDKHGNRYNSSKDGIVVEDTNGNRYTNDSNGVKIEVIGDANIEASGNALIAAKDTRIGSSGAAQSVCLKGLADWLLTHNHMGNMGAPAPVFPADLAVLQTKLTTPGGGVVSNKVNETVEVSG